MRFETALTGGSPVWSGTSSPGRQNKTGGQRAARGQRPRPPPCRRSGTPPPARTQGRAQTPWELASHAPGTRPAAPWTGDCPSPPLPRRTYSSANSSRDAGNFLTSALGPRHRPVPVATAPGATAPRPAPSFKVPRRSPPGSASWIPALGSYRRAGGGARGGAGRSRAEPDAPGRSPGRTTPPPGWAGRAAPRACVQVAQALRVPRPLYGPGRISGEGERVRLTCLAWRRGRGGFVWRPVRGIREVFRARVTEKPRDSLSGPRRSAAPLPNEGFSTQTLPPSTCRTCCNPHTTSPEITITFLPTEAVY